MPRTMANRIGQMQSHLLAAFSLITISFLLANSSGQIADEDAGAENVGRNISKVFEEFTTAPKLANNTVEANQVDAPFEFLPQKIEDTGAENVGRDISKVFEEFTTAPKLANDTVLLQQTKDTGAENVGRDISKVYEEFTTAPTLANNTVEANQEDAPFEFLPQQTKDTGVENVGRDIYKVFEEFTAPTLANNTVEVEANQDGGLFVFLPQQTGIQFFVGEIVCNGKEAMVPGNGTETASSLAPAMKACIGEIGLSVEAVQIPRPMKTYSFKLPRQSPAIRGFQIHFGHLEGKLRGRLTWAGRWDKELVTQRHFSIVLSRFAVIDGHFKEPRHWLGQGPVEAENGKFEVEVDGLKPTAMYMWIYETKYCDPDEEGEHCNQEGESTKERKEKLFHAIILENPTLSAPDGSYEFEYEIDMNGMDDSKQEKFTERYTKMFREQLNKKWLDWWDLEGRQFRLAETVALGLQQVDFVFEEEPLTAGAGEEIEQTKNTTVIVSGKPAVDEMHMDK